MKSRKQCFRTRFRRLRLAAIVLSSVSVPAISSTTVFGQNSNWTNAAGGLYHTPSNWSLGIPGPTGTAQFNLGGAYTVTLDADATMGTLQAPAGTITFLPNSTPRTLTVTTINALGGNVLFTSPQLTLNGLVGINVSGGGSMTLNNGISTAFNSFTLGSSPNTSGGTLIVEGAGTALVGSSTSLYRVGGSSNSPGTLTVRNGGLVDLDGSASAILRVAGNTNNTTGTINVESGGLLTTANMGIGAPASGTFINNNGTVNLSGATSQITQAGAATLQIGAATNNNIGQFNVSGGTFTSGTGQTSVAAGSSIAHSGGTYNANGNIQILGTFSHSGGQFNLASGRTVEVNGGGVWNGTGSTALVLSNGTLNAFGSATVNTPSLQLNSGSTANINIGTVNAGTLSIAGSAVSILNGGDLIATGTSTFSTGSSLTLSSLGTATFSGPLTLGTGSNVVLNSGTTFNQNGSLDLRGSLTASSGANYNFAGNLGVSSGGTFFSANAMTIGNAQSVSVSGANSVFQPNSLALEAGGTLAINGGTVRSNLVLNGGNVAFNSGTLNHTASLLADGATVNALLGSTATIAAGRNLVVDGTTNMDSAITLNGGRFSTGSLTGGNLLILNQGTMQISGSTLTVGSTGQFGSLLAINTGLTVETTNNRNATVAADGRVVVNGGTFGSAGTLTNNGEVQLTSAQSTLRGGTLVNNSMLVGTGRIENSLQNNATGTVQVAGGERLVFSGSSNVNTGHLNSTDGGRLEFRSAVTNNAGGLIGGSDGNLRFDGGLVNNGAIAISAGTTDIFGDINNAAGGIINISGGSAATFFEDVIQNGTMQIVSVGNTNSSAIIFGSLSGAGGFTGGGDLFALGDLRPGNSPDSVLYDGNLFLGSTTDTFIELGGPGVGDFDQLVVTGDLGVGGDLSVSLINGFALEDNMQFLIGDVGGSLTGQFAGLGEGSLVGSFGGRDLFITYQGGSGNGVSLFTSIPEPGVAGIALLAVVGLALVRRRPARSPR
jgi:hypothetical protein